MTEFEEKLLLHIASIATALHAIADAVSDAGKASKPSRRKGGK